MRILQTIPPQPPCPIDDVRIEILPGVCYRTRAGYFAFILAKNPVRPNTRYWIGIVFDHHGTFGPYPPSLDMGRHDDQGYPDAWQESGLHGGTAMRDYDLMERLDPKEYEAALNKLHELLLP